MLLSTVQVSIHVPPERPCFQKCYTNKNVKLQPGELLLIGCSIIESKTHDTCEKGCFYMHDTIMGKVKGAKKSRVATGQEKVRKK